jgi:hypothetical protein
MLDKYKALAPTWMKLTPAQQMEFYLDIEDKFPFLRLCEDHYKARKIGTLDYTHWYKNRVLKIKTKAGKKRRHSVADPDAEDTGNKHARRMPSLPRRASRRICRLESRTRSQVSGKSVALGPSRPSTPSPSPPHPDSPPVPGSSPHTPTPVTTPSSLPPDTQTGSPTTLTTDGSDKSPILNTNKPVPSTIGLNKTPDSHSNITPTAGRPPSLLVVSFFPPLRLV